MSPVLFLQIVNCENDPLSIIIFAEDYLSTTINTVCRLQVILRPNLLYNLQLVFCLDHLESGGSPRALCLNEKCAILGHLFQSFICFVAKCSMRK